MTLHYTISFKQVSNLCRKLRHKITFSQNLHFYVSAGQNKTLAKLKELFSYRNPFDSCLILKNWNHRK